MRAVVRASLRLLPVLLLVACGGRVGPVGGQHEEPDAEPDGNGPPACPVTGDVQPGASCDYATMGNCLAPYQAVVCGGIDETGSCSCVQNMGSDPVWECNAPATHCAEAGPTGCPEPAAITPGLGCDTSSSLSCPSEVPIVNCDGQVEGAESCSCLAATWVCGGPQPFCIDAGPSSCPDPASVETGVPCSPLGLQCPGNPQECGGAVFYDAFVCEDDRWVDVATTECSAGDGGPVDASLSDAQGL